VNEAFSEVLARWQNFFLLTGTAAATLMGLVFVAGALATSASQRGTARSRQTFVTPILKHFGYVLAIAVVSLVPIHSARSYGLSLLAIGFVLFLQTLNVLRGIREHGAAIAAVHWIWHFVMPLLASLGLVAMGTALCIGLKWAEAGIALNTALLLAIATRNSWALATWIIEQTS
jgi:hypothetical protein